jgi:hypothetical protein
MKCCDKIILLIDFSQNLLLIKVDPTGPLSNIRKLLLSGDVINTVKEFLTEKWWAAVLIALGFFIIMVRICNSGYRYNLSFIVSSV